MTVLRTPSFPGGAWPAAEPRRRTARIRLVASLALLASTGYVLWRATSTLDLSVWWLAVPLLLLELHAVVGLGLHTAGLWDVDTVRPPEPVHATGLRLAVLIPTYDEALEVLLPTVAAALAVRLPHETWVLDDGDRPEVRRLAEQLGARYLARTDRSHAKAGNVNHALAVVEADVVALLDADHVADPELFRRTLGHFDDPTVAFVQTPQDFYNVDSFEHTGTRWTSREVDYRFAEQSLFYRALQPGRNRWGAAFCCGTGALFRTDALRSVGGMATETVTEDIHTSIRLHRRGWRSVYHNEVLARGLAASAADQFLEQRLRWGTGAMQVLRVENPAFVSGLRPMQRVSYLTTLLGWFDSWRTLGYLLAPMVVVVTGAVPVRATLPTFLAWFLPVLLLQSLALRALSRGRAPAGTSTVFDLVRMPANLLATTRLVSRRPRAFTVTRKGRTGDVRARTSLPRLHVLLLVGSAASAAWFVATTAGLTPVTYGVPWAADGAAVWLCVNSVLLVLAVRRISQQQYGSERRSAVRFPVQGDARLGGHAGQMLDASLTGFRMVLRQPNALAVGDHLRAAIGPREDSVQLDVVVRSCVLRGGPVGPEHLVGVEVLPGQLQEQARLSQAVFGGASPVSAPVPLQRGVAQEQPEQAALSA